MAPPERRWRRLATAAVLVVLPLPAGASELRVTVEGIRSAHGTILIGLYDTAESFDKAVEASDKEGFLIDPDRFGAVALRANAAMKSAVVFSNLDPGRYAAEPYGFSNNVNGFLSPPSFDDAIMVLGHGDSTVRIKLIYH
jgi:uncharacterized protein (DUF2141 family)